jgi:hypothetical protein
VRCFEQNERIDSHVRVAVLVPPEFTQMKHE